MPTHRLYDIQITNQYTDETTEYKEVPTLKECSETVNNHFSCPMITKHGITNLMCRGRDGSPERFIGVRITCKKPCVIVSFN